MDESEADTEPPSADVGGSAALQFLEQGVADGSIASESAERFRKSFEDLHKMVLLAYEREKKALRNSRALKEQLQQQTLQVEKSGTASFDDKSSKGSLTRDLLKARMELELVQGRVASVEVETEQLRAEEAALREEERLQEEARRVEQQPALERDRKAIQALQSERGKLQEQVARLRKEKKENDTRLAEDREKKLEMASRTKHLHNEVMRKKDEETKLKQNIKVLRDAYTDLKTELGKRQETIASLESTHTKTMDQLVQMREDIQAKKAELARVMSNAENRKHEADTQESEREGIEARTRAMLENATSAESEMERKKTELQVLAEQASRLAKERQTLLRERKSTEDEVEALLTSIKALEREKAEAMRVLEHETEVVATANAEREKMKRDVDLYVYNFLSQEFLGKAKADEVRALLDEVGTREKELKVLQTKEKSLLNEISFLALEREKAARQCTRIARDLKQAEEQKKVNDLMVADHDKNVNEVLRQYKEYQALFNTVQNERNRHVALLQQAQQRGAEYKEKLKVLVNEIEILRAEIGAKDKEWLAHNLAYKNACTQRDALRIEVNKFLYEYEKKRDVIDQQLAEIERLNSAINTAERQMLALKAEYEQAVEDRNYTGIQLIDRNDELCILYEKSNFQEQILRTGEIAIKEREEELRMLTLRRSEVLRQMEVTEAKATESEKEALMQQISQLAYELKEEQKIVEKLSVELEDPSNKERKNELQGGDPPTDQLYESKTQLEARLNEKEEQLLEKTLVLEEVSNLSERLRKQAAHGREDTLELAKQVNEYQARIRETTRKMMATVSELSMYQATAMKLRQEKLEKDAQLAEAAQRLERGEAPTADAVKMWASFLDRQRRAAVDAEREESPEPDPTQGPPSTAQPRITAYIPHHTTGQLPIPMPFLFPRFEPTETGSSMRHTRNPRSPAIEL